MKKLFTLLALVITLITFAQVPQGFNYQATVRNSSGVLIVNQNVLVKFNVLQNSANGTIVYSENQSANTDDLGHINLVVGQGTATTGTFSTINWGSGSYYLEIELNIGSGYVAMGTTQLLSVPYALYANSSASSTPQNLNSVLNAGNSANTTKIINLGDPVNPKDAVNKEYVDAKILLLQNYINTLPVTDVDGNTYLPVTICNQTWTKSNLNVTHYRNGDVIPQVTDPTQWANLTTGAWCYYNNDPANGAIYGILYNWYAVNDPRGLAPQGWHVPTAAEWSSLTNCLGDASVAGEKLKSTSTLWQSPNIATNVSGFTALPAGYRSNQGDFYNKNDEFWISLNNTFFNPALYKNLRYNLRTINAYNLFGYYNHFTEKAGVSIRCIKD
jgi:uncharacterized protein (TIGR02145 family)